MNEKINVVLCGNKYVADELNKKYFNSIYTFYDSNTENKDISGLLKEFDYINNLTNRQDLPNIKGIDIVYIFMDCFTDVSNKPDTFSKKSLYYFRQGYRELSAYYGIPLVDSSGTIDEIGSRLMYALENRSELELYSLRYLSPTVISDNDIENYLFNTNEDIDEYWDYLLCNTNIVSKETVKKTLCARHLCQNADIQICQDGVVLFKYIDEVKDKVYRQVVYTSLTKPRFRLVYESENKKIYVPLSTNRFLRNTCFAIVKPSITNSLGIYIEMMNRSGLQHIYNAINDKGVVSSEYINPYPEIKVVYEGNNSTYYNPNIYLEESFNKVDNYSKNLIMKFFMTMYYYFDKVGYQLDNNNIILKLGIQSLKSLKICDIFSNMNNNIYELLRNYFSLNNFSETEAPQQYRYPYMFEAERILSSNLFKDEINQMHKMYQEWTRYEEKRRVFSQLCVSHGKLVFPLCSKPKYTEMKIKDIFNLLCIGSDISDIIVYDVDKDLTQFESNEEFLINNTNKYNYYISGGIDDVQSAKNVLKENIKGVFISGDILTGYFYESESSESSESSDSESSESNSDKEEFINMLKELPVNKVIIDINIQYKTNISFQEIETALSTLKSLGIYMIRLIIDSTKKIDEKLFRSFVIKFAYFARDFSTIIISSPLIKTLDDLRFLWSIKGVCPELGNFIWNEIVKYEDVIVEITKFDSNGFIPICIQDINKQVKNVVNVDSVALKKIIVEKVYEDYEVLQFVFSKNNSSIMLTVEHNNTKSYFETNNNSLDDTSSIIENINHNLLTDKSEYLNKVKEIPGLVMLDICDNYSELLSTNSYDTKVAKSAEIIFDILCTFVDKNIKWKDVLKKLNKKIDSPQIKSVSNNLNYVVIGIIKNKYENEYIDKYTKECLGIELERTSNNINYVICDREKFNTYFGTTEVKFIGIDHKDIFHYIGNGLIDYCITYNFIIDNYPKLSIEINSAIIHELRLCLVNRKIDTINIRDNKPKIILEYSSIVKKYLNDELYIDNNRYDISKCTGSSVNILLNDNKYLLSDCIVRTDGIWIKENGLSIWKTVVKSGHVKIGLYKKI